MGLRWIDPPEGVPADIIAIHRELRGQFRYIYGPAPRTTEEAKREIEHMRRCLELRGQHAGS